MTTDDVAVVPMAYGLSLLMLIGWVLAISLYTVLRADRAKSVDVIPFWVAAAMNVALAAAAFIWLIPAMFYRAVLAPVWQDSNLEMQGANLMAWLIFVTVAGILVLQLASILAYQLVRFGWRRSHLRLKWYRQIRTKEIRNKREFDKFWWAHYDYPYGKADAGK